MTETILFLPDGDDLIGCECVLCQCSEVMKLSEAVSTTMWLDEAAPGGGGMHIVAVCRGCAKGEHERPLRFSDVDDAFMPDVEAFA